VIAVLATPKRVHPHFPATFAVAHVLLLESGMLTASFNAVTSEIIGAAIEVHRILGPGLLESLYLQCLQLELTQRGQSYMAQVVVPIAYKGKDLGTCHRLDLIVDERVVVEVKSVDVVAPVHRAQLLTYLKLTSSPVGLLINFNEARLVDGVHRVINPAVK
jgi:GxxExxY protein